MDLAGVFQHPSGVLLQERWKTQGWGRGVGRGSFQSWGKHLTERGLCSSGLCLLSLRFPIRV